jgi:hypothetical protein
VKELGGAGRDLPLQNLAVTGAFNAGGLGAADVKAKDGSQWVLFHWLRVCAYCGRRQETLTEGTVLRRS